MEIIQNKTKLTVVNTEVPNYKYVHIIEKVTTSDRTIFSDKIATSYSEHTLTTDGHYVITSMKITTIAGSGYYITGDAIYDPLDVRVFAEDLLLIPDYTITNIIEEHQDFMSIYITNTYYLNLIQTKFLRGLCTCGCIDAQEKLTVDSLTMGLILIDQLIYNSLYYEAEVVIEKLAVCTGITNTGCGCHG